MKILLDTHIFIWFVEDDPQLLTNSKKIIENEKNVIYLSIASLWEIAIKLQLKKLSISRSIEEIVDLIRINGFELLPILPEHIIELTKLEFHHRDPFDRIIIAQCLSESFIPMSKDEIFDKYGIRRLWN
jgi:PIN domain nuclease of toxin-antitoxin system